MHFPLRLSRLAPILAALALLLFASPTWADEVIVDNAQSRVIGPWQATDTTGGFYASDYLFRTAGDGSLTVTWAFPEALAAGRYEVYARWTSGPNRATNATYRVANAAGGAEVVVSQKSNGGTWQRLGVFEFQPGKGHGVTLTDKADGVVVADAIRWVGPTNEQPALQAVVSPQATPSPAPAPAQPVSPAAPSPTPNPADPRYFPQTRYRIAEDAFWDFYQKRGGARTFGYPVSNTFTLFGMKTQVFQRQILQLRGDGGVQTMNLLDEGLMPYTRVNGSVFPAPDANVTSQAPSPSDPAYLEKAIQFVREMAPDEWDGQNVGFTRTFLSTVEAKDAFPNGVPEGLEGLLPGFNLEIWGLPTSRPTYDPNNRNFIYQRFQRGIMHYDKSTGLTQGLLLADYFKAIATGKNLPGDLAEQAKGSRYFTQWAPGQPLALARPDALPGSNWTDAFRRDPTITVDAGHGGKEIGTSARYPDGTVLLEKTLNLRVAQRLRELLLQAGYDVVMTRTSDAQVNADNKDLTGDGKVNVSDDLQARVDVANRTRSDLLISVHFNGVADPNVKGTYVFWATERPHSDRNKALAEFVDAALVRELRNAGYNTVDRGARADATVLGGGHYFLLGPKSDVISRPSEMPAIIGEPLFLTNADDANAVRQDQIVEAVARGYLEGIKAYFAKYPPS